METSDKTKSNKMPAMAKGHLSIFKQRLSTLRLELDEALKTNEQFNREISYWKSRSSSIKDDIDRRQLELETSYARDSLEYNKQLELAKDMLSKKRAEKESLLNFLVQSKIFESHIVELKAFDWDSWKNLALTSARQTKLEHQVGSAEMLSSLNQKALSYLNMVNDLVHDTYTTKSKFTEELNKILNMNKEYAQIKEAQESKINKLESANERLNLLVKQCFSEPTSGFIARNVREKCQSFLNSGTEQELIEGLKKYELRQRRVIKLLKHKENKLSREQNLLEIARDQTNDDGLYYMTLLAKSGVSTGK